MHQPDIDGERPLTIQKPPFQIKPKQFQSTEFNLKLNDSAVKFNFNDFQNMRIAPQNLIEWLGRVYYVIASQSTGALPQFLRY